jgi:hypothetical protein
MFDFHDVIRFLLLFAMAVGWLLPDIRRHRP